jgi:hypothetical protein
MVELGSGINISGTNENMKILTSRIKKWSFKQRLFEMEKRLRNVEDEINISEHAGVDVRADMSEAMQILEYWMENMKGEVTKTLEAGKPKVKKPVNLW